ncbi:uroporphyrinogen-III C-methyltransferase [Salipaludibacillus keqinensis]|uniref:Uroporphyrinogen-III C-methyltransferase n=1 Tax=Salipaludibacillus keqinensis TaxID=2045207 RepID=A0A323TIZ8_9BACI|nr:uroporphyrinogen-III C-methyltransferase [Salipaludibacillus keqinensis]PYZ94788.1 uroporphyrinogen-III C-methyltransferase [Salipaludibacillus keqinensis]
MSRKGKVIFLGAGPGDPELMTIKGANALKQADVIVYDRLVNKDLLDYAKPLVELIYCGKLPNRHIIPQEQINDILVHHALKGKTVVRLKGGDPAIFGRVGEEASCCAEKHISFEMIPGITSGMAAPLFAGIPLTHRDFSSSCAFITGHKRTDIDRPDIEWEKLATSVDTLVFYMGVGNINMIQEELMKHGRSPETPVALVRWGTTSNQETLTGTLTTIAEDVERAEFKSPAVIVVGNVVKLREKLAWFEEKKQEEFPLAQVK